jgi:hypothetical protein
MLAKDIKAKLTFICPPSWLLPLQKNINKIIQILLYIHKGNLVTFLV